MFPYGLIDEYIEVTGKSPGFIGGLHEGTSSHTYQLAVGALTETIQREKKLQRQIELKKDYENNMLKSIPLELPTKPLLINDKYF